MYICLKEEYMKNVILLMGFAFACFVGCSTTPVPYSFTENGTGTATITFVGGNPGLRLIYFERYELPAPEKMTHWEPISFPAGRSLRITVHAYYQQSNTEDQGWLATIVTTAITSSRSVNRDVTFECPALDAGKDYKLAFRKGAGIRGKNLLVLTEIKTRKIVHEEEFESI
jgi:hypothetical protein